MQALHRWLIFWASGLFVLGCQSSDPMVAVNTLIEAPDDYASRRVGSTEYPVPPFAKYLKDVKICLNPGHGGDAEKRGFKRGPTGVREAEMNFRVAHYLEAFLVVAGADVILTRSDDIFLSYEDRTKIADNWGADLFVSLHHNAVDDNPDANYTTVWYHGDVNGRPSNLDLARYLCDGLYGELALPQITGVPLKSDQLMYETGFAVLQHATVTAALCESSFFSNPEEEQRLRQPEYNLREAYGVFIGLAKYAAAGLPRASLVEPTDGTLSLTQTNPFELVFELDDGLRSRKSWGHARNMILADTIVVRVGGRTVPHIFEDNGQRYLLTVSLPSNLSRGDQAIELQFQNMNKNSVLNPDFEISVR